MTRVIKQGIEFRLKSKKATQRFSDPYFAKVKNKLAPGAKLQSGREIDR